MVYTKCKIVICKYNIYVNAFACQRACAVHVRVCLHILYTIIISSACIYHYYLSDHRKEMSTMSYAFKKYQYCLGTGYAK